jgi:murein DD-endopeptidase MepM/ murein hydrolase activator NlpD
VKRNLILFVLAAFGVALYFTRSHFPYDDRQVTSGTVTNTFSDTPSVRWRSDIVPLSRFTERVTKKPFGRYITPDNSPVQPERFRGYHTGTDFETFENEADSDVSIFAILDGKVLERRMATGYGGVVVTSGFVDGERVTVVYGHVRLSSVRVRIGDSVFAGDTLAVLGKGYSAETDGERKHLHLSIHRGAGVNIRGYVPSQAGLNNWIDPMLLLQAGSGHK